MVWVISQIDLKTLFEEGNQSGFLAPYFERAVLRFGTPSKSNTPRTTLYFTPGRSLVRPPRSKRLNVPEGYEILLGSLQ